MTAQEAYTAITDALAQIRTGEPATMEAVSDATHTISEALGRMLSETVLAVAEPERPALVEMLMRDRYHDTNAMLQAVFAQLDEQTGLHFSFQQAAYPTDRVAAIGASLQDTAEAGEERIRRRAKSVANVANALYDDCLHANAEARSAARLPKANCAVSLAKRAVGVKCYIYRKTDGKCCKWCTSVAGHYVYREEPADLWRRHDHCGCTITITNGRERNVLRGTGKKWQQTQGKQHPDVRSYEEAKAINARLTNGGDSGIIKLDDIVVGKSLGAKSQNYDVVDLQTGEIFHLVEGTRIQNAQVFAGKGTKTPLHDGVAEGLTLQFGGNAAEWQHAKGHAVIDYHGEEVGAEIHWFQEPSVGKVKFKVKRWDEE